jgi:hypothetical protein
MRLRRAAPILQPAIVEYRKRLCQAGRAPTVAGCRLLVVMGWTRFTSRQLLYLRWKTRVIGFCSGLATLTSMVPSAARV